MRLGASYIARGGRQPQEMGTPAGAGCFLLAHRDVLPHVVGAGVHPNRVMHDPVYDRIGMHPGSKPLMPVLLRILGGEHHFQDLTRGGPERTTSGLEDYEYILSPLAPGHAIGGP